VPTSIPLHPDGQLHIRLLCPVRRDLGGERVKAQLLSRPAAGLQPLFCRVNTPCMICTR